MPDNSRWCVPSAPSRRSRGFDTFDTFAVYRATAAETAGARPNESGAATDAATVRAATATARRRDRPFTMSPLPAADGAHMLPVTARGSSGRVAPTHRATVAR